MLKTYRRQFNIWCVLSDTAAAALSFVLAYALRAWALPGYWPGLDREPLFGWERYLPVLFLCGAAVVASLFAVGGYRMSPGRPWHAVLASNVKGVAAAVLLTLAAAAALRLTYLSRLFVALFFLSFLFLATVGKLLVSRSFGVLGTKGIHHRILLLVGCNAQARQIALSFQKGPHLGVTLRGFLAPDRACDARDLEEMQRLGLPRLGEASNLPALLQREVVDGVLFAAEPGMVDRFEELCLTCEDSGVDVLIPVNPFPHLIARTKLEKLDDFSLLHFTTVSHDFVPLFFKRLLDASGAAAGLLLLSPLFLSVALLIKITDPGPVFFRQERVGLHGRRFRLVKFRTMVRDAERRLTELKHLNEADGPVFKMRQDPRVTKLGRLLRKSSVDELPQLWNVLLGQMSLVGPRPPLASEVERYERWQRRRLSMRPGLTCLWQVSGRSELDFDTWMKLDLQYIDNWSLGLDFLILLKTVPAVFSGRGAA